MGNINFASKVHLGVMSNNRAAKGTAISLLLVIGGPIKLMYVIALIFRSVWELKKNV